MPSQEEADQVLGSRGDGFSPTHLQQTRDMQQREFIGRQVGSADRPCQHKSVRWIISTGGPSLLFSQGGNYFTSPFNLFPPSHRITNPPLRMFLPMIQSVLIRFMNFRAQT